ASNESEVANQQQENSAKIAKRPTQARNFSYIILGGYLRNLGEVVYFSEFDGDRANRENGQAKPEIKWGIIANEIQRGHQYKSEKRPECKRAPPGSMHVGALAHNWRDRENHQASHGHGYR